jgi:hypothetical protein
MPLVTARAPGLLAPYGIGLETAALLLITAGDHPGRLRPEAAWADLCATAPIPLTGKVTHHRSTLAMTARPTKPCGGSAARSPAPPRPPSKQQHPRRHHRPTWPLPALPARHGPNAIHRCRDSPSPDRRSTSASDSHERKPAMEAFPLGACFASAGSVGMRSGELFEHLPAVHVRRPGLDYGSHATRA